MARAALGLEVRPACGDIADQHGLTGRYGVATRRTALSLHRRGHTVQVDRDRLYVVVGQRDGWHLALAVLDDRQNELSHFVFQRDFRPDQVRSALVAAAQVVTVTELTI